jgi:class 3 adenylate cyclase
MLIALVLAVAVIAVLIGLWRRAERIAAARAATIDRVSSDLEHLQRSFHRFVPQQVVEGIIHRGVQTHGERREVTVLFADLVGFTNLSERTEPEVVVRILNGYFQAMAGALAAHNGFVSKFMGDGILALFGAPEPNPWQSMDAVRGALAMRDALVRYNAELAADGLDPLQVSIGVHRGPVVAGVLGSTELVEYTVIGDAVNTAARVEGLTRRFGVGILVTKPVVDALDARFAVREMEPAELKGKAAAVVTWAVDGLVASSGR